MDLIGKFLRRPGLSEQRYFRLFDFGNFKGKGPCFRYRNNIG